MKKIVDSIKNKGVRYLSDYDLLKLITQVKDCNLEANNEISESINISEKSFIELLNKKSLNEAQACSLIASLELGRRLYSCSLKKITKASDIYPEIQHYADRKQEQFIVVSLNGAHEIIAIRVVSIGTLTKTIIHPREVFSDPIADRAAAIIIAHNHPSGNTEPSDEDILITERLTKAGTILGIPVLDHLILSPNCDYISFVELGIPI